MYKFLQSISITLTSIRTSKKTFTRTSINNLRLLNTLNSLGYYISTYTSSSVLLAMSITISVAMSAVISAVMSVAMSVRASANFTSYSNCCTTSCPNNYIISYSNCCPCYSTAAAATVAAIYIYTT